MRTAGNYYIGPISDEAWWLLKCVWKWGLALQCDIARKHASELALLASQGWCSTVDPDGRTYRNRWRITEAGILMLKNKDMLK